jgi:hypothetical protein
VNLVLFKSEDIHDIIITTLNREFEILIPNEKGCTPSSYIEKYGILSMPDVTRRSLLKEAFIMTNHFASNKITHKGSTPH